MKKNVSVIISLLAILIIALTVSAQTVTPIDFNSFQGTGFDNPAAAGNLDSDNWSITGLSDGDCTFGATCTTGDFARGTDYNGTSTGGVYAFDVSGGAGTDYILGMQPAGSDFTPGTLYLRVQNTTGVTIADIYTSYEFWYNNDQPRSNSLVFSMATSADGDCAAATYGPDIDSLATPGTADAGSWTLSATNTNTAAGINLANNEYVCLRWVSDDISGSGSRDEFGIDDVEVRIGGPTAVSLQSFNAKQVTNWAWLPAICLVLALGLVIVRKNGRFSVQK
jgi:hypothetical protein